MTDHQGANESADDWTMGVAAFVMVSCPRCQQRLVSAPWLLSGLRLRQAAAPGSET